MRQFWCVTTAARFVTALATGAFHIPWGNIAFYYNTAGVGYSDQTPHLGTSDATAEELEAFEGQETIVEVVR